MSLCAPRRPFYSYGIHSGPVPRRARSAVSGVVWHAWAPPGRGLTWRANSSWSVCGRVFVIVFINGASFFSRGGGERGKYPFDVQLGNRLLLTSWHRYPPTPLALMPTPPLLQAHHQQPLHRQPTNYQATYFFFFLFTSACHLFFN